jgi:hypothetical protein
MLYKDIKKGMRVHDTWWPFETRGNVVEILKTRIRIKFLAPPPGYGWNASDDNVVTYDMGHCQFLKKGWRC